MVEHRVHVAGADGEAQPRPAERPPGVAGVPIGLAEDRHPKALGLQHPPQQGHGETRMIDVGVAGDKDHVDGVPPPRRHFGRRHRQRRSDGLGVLGHDSPVAAGGCHCRLVGQCSPVTGNALSVRDELSQTRHPHYEPTSPAGQAGSNTRAGSPQAVLGLLVRFSIPGLLRFLDRRHSVRLGVLLRNQLKLKVDDLRGEVFLKLLHCFQILKVLPGFVKLLEPSSDFTGQ